MEHPPIRLNLIELLYKKKCDVFTILVFIGRDPFDQRQWPKESRPLGTTECSLSSLDQVDPAGRGKVTLVWRKGGLANWFVQGTLGRRMTLLHWKQNGVGFMGWKKNVMDWIDTGRLFGRVFDNVWFKESPLKEKDLQDKLWMLEVVNNGNWTERQFNLVWNLFARF